jgi:hypothetical protein
MIEYLIQHQFWAAVGITWIFSAAVSAMPEPAAYRPCASRPDPGPNARPGYLWLYRFVHTIAGNITTAFGNRIPGLKILLLSLLVPLMFCTTGCAAQYRVHPGALNQTDSAAYDTLLIAETVIDQARLDYQNQKLPPRAKDALNTLIQSYTVARESWLTYRGVLATNIPPGEYIRELSKNLSDLTNAIRALRESAASASPTRSASAIARSLREGRSHQEMEVKK